MVGWSKANQKKNTLHGSYPKRSINGWRKVTGIKDNNSPNECVKILVNKDLVRQKHWLGGRTERSLTRLRIGPIPWTEYFINTKKWFDECYPGSAQVEGTIVIASFYSIKAKL